MHLLIKPVVRLLARFSWNLKFLIIGLAATCVMAVLVIMASATERATLAATRDEVRGLDVFEPTLKLLVLMQQHRGLASGALGGNAAMTDATDKKTAEVDAAFAQVDTVTRAAPAAWELDASLQKLRTQWSSLRDGGMSMSADANFRAHTELVEGLMAQINHLGDESGLILDPESETYHGIIAVMGYMPQVTEQLGKMRGLGSGILAQKHISDEQRIALAGLSGSLRLSYGFLRNALDSAIHHKTHYAATVTTLLDAMDGEINESIMLAESEVMSSNFGVSPQDYFDTVSKPINLLVSTTTQKLLPTLRGELQARETRSQRDLSLELALSILGALLLLGGFAALHRSLREALDALIVGTRALAGGDFRHRITIDTRDEMAALAGHFNDMSIAVSNALGSVIRDARRVQEAATEMARISASVRGQAQQQSDSASSIAAAVEETAVSMSEIARHATETESASSEAQRDAGEGSAQVERVAGGMEHIADVINASAHSVRVLGERSAEISQLTATIREIADQTNLLALNAAIEAARAGETGRGFAVVADEVRKLAERTSKTSGEIAQMVAAIASGTDEAARALETGVSQVREGVTRSREAGHHMDAIRGSTDRVLGAVSDIGLALREQRTANEEVARNVEAIARMAEAAANEVEQAADTASRLQGMADELQRSVARFSVA